MEKYFVLIILLNKPGTIGIFQTFHLFVVLAE